MQYEYPIEVELIFVPFKETIAGCSFVWLFNGISRPLNYWWDEYESVHDEMVNDLEENKHPILFCGQYDSRVCPSHEDCWHYNNGTCIGIEFGSTTCFIEDPNKVPLI